MNEKTTCKIIQDKYMDLFQFIKKLLESSSNAIKVQNVNSLTKAVVLFHYVRALNLLRGICTLCESGNGVEATILLRSLLNLFINLKWLTKEDTENRMRKFAEFDIINKKLTMDVLKKYGSFENPKDAKDFSVHDDEFEKIKSKYNLKSNWDFYNWSGKSIRKMAEDLGLERDYFIVYGHLSKIEHTSPSSVRNYLDDSEEGIVGTRVGASDEYVAISLITSPQYFLPIKKITFSNFELKLDEIENDYKRLRELDRKYANL